MTKPLQQVWALVQVQSRTMLNSLRHRSGGGSRKVSLAIASFWYGFWTFAAVACAILPQIVGIEDIQQVLPGVLLFIMGYWQLAPLLTLSLGVSLEMRKTAIYPISMPTLFFVECLLRVGTGIEMLLLLSGFLGGLALAGSPHLMGIAAAFVLFATFNVFLSAGVRNLVERVFHQRRLREFLLVLLICGTVFPQVLIWSQTAREIARAVFSAFREFPFWLLPSGLAAKIASGDASPQRVMVLVAMVVAAAWFGYHQFRRGCQVAGTLSTGSGAAALARKGLRASWIERMARLPSRVMPDPMGVLVEKEVKYLWRSPRFRLPFFMGFTFGVIAWVPIMSQWRLGWGAWMQQSAVTLISLYSFLLLGPVLFLNRFGFDRSAARFYFWLPLNLKQLLLAKNAASVVFAAFEVALVASVCALVGVEVGPPQMAEAIAVCSIALLYLLSVGNYMSVRFPVASNPDRISRSGPGHGLRAAVQFLLFPLALLPLIFALWIRYRGENAAAFLGLLALCLAGGLALYLLTLSAMARRGELGREHFLSQLTESEGPVATE